LVVLVFVPLSKHPVANTPSFDSKVHGPGRALSAYTTVSALLLSFLLLTPAAEAAQQKPVAAKPAAKAKTVQSKTNQKKTTPKNIQSRPGDELARLREEFVKATNEYKGSLEQLRASYEKSLQRAEADLTKSRELFVAGLISRKTVETGELAVAKEKDKLADVDRQMASADSQISHTLLEAEAEKKLAKSKPLPKGGMLRTAALIRYNGSSVWALSEAWKVQRFFLDAFKKPLPVAVFGQGSIHDRWRLDHRNAMDVSLHPDGPEGQAVLGFLRANGIPFLAFRQAIPGTATGPHIHIGRPSHRY
jgi:outer membrane efflux protein